MRSLDPRSADVERPVIRVLGPASLLVLLWEVAKPASPAGQRRPRPAGSARLSRRRGPGLAPGDRRDPPQRTAIVLPTAMRDFAVAAGIAVSAFGPAAAAPLGIYGLLVLIFGSAAVYAARSRRPGPGGDFSPLS